MAKIKEGIHFTGTIGNLCFYQVGDRTYLRAKSSLSRKRVLKSKEFEKTRKHAKDLGRASRIGSEIYQALPADTKGRWLFREITGEAASLLYKGKNEAEVKEYLWKKYIQDSIDDNIIVPGMNRLNIFPSSSRQSRQRLKSLLLDRWRQRGRSASDFKRRWEDGDRMTPSLIPLSLS